MLVGLPLVVLSQTSKGLKCVDGEASFLNNLPCLFPWKNSRKGGAEGGGVVSQIFACLIHASASR